MIYVLTGNGKGKTTSALGMGMRAAGAGKNVLMVQFLKDGTSSEINEIKKISNFQIKSFGRPGFGPYFKEDSQLAKSGFIFAQNSAQSQKYSLLLLDEINVAMHFKLIGVEEVVEFLKEYGKNTDIVLTGRYCPKEIIKIADLVTELKEIKHYFKKRSVARKGIEY
ncbi:MAG: cob(I)yrinic acid a,c-diamide adenosyltransferase [Candidatus Nealsonbacteria bacterium]|nr:cob(I)yrinic acid a,c-diamide adenosyltransferase [Candidatus Nealsonbacteria bacterium]